MALGCHVAQVNVNAEDDLKKIKLPKEYDFLHKPCFLLA